MSAEVMPVPQIESVADLRRCLGLDQERYPGDSPLQRYVRHPQLRWLARLRVTEWWCNTRRGRLGRVVGAALRQRLQAAGTRLGYTIPINVVGAGLKLPHIGTIVVSGDAQVGTNCCLLQGVTLGSHQGAAPRLGRDVYLGPNVTVLGGVTVGDEVAIGAGSVVTHDVPSGEVWAGVPAKRLRALR